MIASRAVVSSARRLSTLPIVSIARKVKVCSHETRTGRLLNDEYFGKTEIYFVSGLKKRRCISVNVPDIYFNLSISIKLNHEWKLANAVTAF